MKNKIFVFIILGLSIMLVNISIATDYDFADKVNLFSEKTFGNLSSKNKKNAIKAYLNGNCSYNGIELKGKVKFVDEFEDIKIKYVSSFADIHVKFTNSFASECGEWEVVSSSEDFKVKVVSSFEDIKVKKVNSFPGMQ